VALPKGDKQAGTKILLVDGHAEYPWQPSSDPGVVDRMSQETQTVCVATGVFCFPLLVSGRNELNQNLNETKVFVKIAQFFGPKEN
jgi:hypothetical protein